jgi:hypothetical protein
MKALLGFIAPWAKAMANTRTPNSHAAPSQISTRFMSWP